MTLQIIYPAEGEQALDLKISGCGHSVEDLLQVWQPLCDDIQVYKQFAAGHHAACVSCINNCCNTAYVTPDIISVRRMAAQHGLSVPDFAHKHFDPGKRALGIPVFTQPCPWLLADGRCSVYEARSLLCRFYLCTPLQGSLEQLIYSLTLIGMLATARELGWDGLKNEAAMTSFDRLNMEEMVNWYDHPGVKAFLLANSYADVPLELFFEKV